MNACAPRGSRLACAFLVAAALVLTCHSQEVAQVDLTNVAPRNNFRRPKSSSSIKGGYRGIDSKDSCRSGTPTLGALRATLVSLDRTRYKPGDRPRFEVKIENVGSTAVEIPISPHSAELQPSDPSKKFSFYELAISLRVGSGQRWEREGGWETGAGGVMLYGRIDRANTMLILKPTEWVRVIDKGEIDLDKQLVDLIRSGQAADHMQVEFALYREEFLITANESAGVGHEVCLVKTYGPSSSIELHVPHLP